MFFTLISKSNIFGLGTFFSPNFISFVFSLFLLNSSSFLMTWPNVNKPPEIWQLVKMDVVTSILSFFFFFLVSLPDRLASSPPSQPESCGCEKFFLTARDFFSDICQVGSWESTCLLYAATSTVGKEDGRLNSPADKLFPSLTNLLNSHVVSPKNETKFTSSIPFFFQAV